MSFALFLLLGRFFAVWHAACIYLRTVEEFGSTPPSASSWRDPLSAALPSVEPVETSLLDPEKGSFLRNTGRRVSRNSAAPLLRSTKSHVKSFSVECERIGASHQQRKATLSPINRQLAPIRSLDWMSPFLPPIRRAGHRRRRESDRRTLNHQAPAQNQ